MKLGDAELEIMLILWDVDEPVTSTYIHKRFGSKRSWALSTVMATLDRLASKGFVACDRSTRTNCYSALVSASEYKAQEGRSFLQRLYKNSLPDFVAALYSDQPIDKAEAEELKRYIDKLTEGQDMYKDVIGGGGG